MDEWTSGPMDIGLVQMDQWMNGPMNLRTGHLYIGHMTDGPIGPSLVHGHMVSWPIDQRTSSGTMGCTAS